MAKQNKQEKRRATLQALAIGGLVALGGCGTIWRRGEPSSKIDPASFPPLDRIKPLLRPTLTSTPATNFPALDAHAHFFNASDVNVKDYIWKCFGHEQSEVSQDFLYTLAIAADFLAGFVPTAAEEFDELIKWLDGGPAPGEDYDLMAQRIYDASLRSGFKSEYDKQQTRYLQELSAMHGSSRVKQQPQGLDVDQIRNLLDPERREQLHVRVFGVPQTMGSRKDPGGFIEFLGRMMSRRSTNIQTYASYYTERPGAFGIQGVFGSLVDFDQWLDNYPYSSRQDQMLLHSLLSAMSGGYMIPLISFNPWAPNPSASYDLMVKAIESFGFAGVKIYPPVGYYPYGNASLLTNPGRYTGNLKDLDATLKKTYDWAARRGVPVMAHAGESMGIDNTADSYGGPKGYAKLLDAYANSPERLAPTILAGHFGGAAANQGEQWPDAFTGFLKWPNGVGRNFYSDVAYWDEFLSCASSPKACQEARDRVARAINGNGGGSHLLYGSDWHMMSKVGGWNRYPFRVREQLCSGDMPIKAEALFHGNTMSCFGFKQSSLQYTRITSRLAATPGGVPGWLRI